jgi:hypothetical protein
MSAMPKRMLPKVCFVIIVQIVFICKNNKKRTFPPSLQDKKTTSRAPGKVNGYEKPGAAEGFKIPECFVC